MKNKKREVYKVGEMSATKQPFIRVNDETFRFDEIPDAAEMGELVTDGVDPSVYTAEEATAVIGAMFSSKTVEIDQDIGVQNFYDFFSAAIASIRESGERVTSGTAEAHFAMATNLAKTVSDLNPYSALGPVFSSLVFEDKMLREIADIIRHDKGPAKSEGLYSCRRCHAAKEFVTSNVKQTRSADEAPTVYNVCNKCGFSWNLNG